MRPLHSIACLLVACCLPFGAAYAYTLNVVGFLGSKALVSVDGGPPRTVAIGQKTPEGFILVAIEGDAATFDVGGRRQTVRMGQHTAAGSGANQGIVVLNADASGHFLSEGTINGGTVRFMVDTGASVIALSMMDAKRIGLNYKEGVRVPIGTANGQTIGYHIKLNTVRVGGVTAHNVDAVITEQPMPFVLLGMSFLNRMDMRREGDRMTLTKRY